MTDIWVCANCRSVNNIGAKQCYQCRTPKDRAAVDPSEIDGTTKGKLREIELPEFQSPRPFAIVASVLIIAVAAVQAVNAVLSVDQVVETVDELGFAVATIETVGPFGLLVYVVAAAALVGFALWLSRAVGSMPALGLGYPAATATTAFLEVFIPGLNLMRIPAILRDVIRRLEPQEGRGDVLIYAAWIGLFGGILLPRAGTYLGLFGATTSDGGAQTLVIVRLFSTLLVLGGAIFLVALIWWIEGRIARRREAQLAGLPPPTPPSDDAPGVTAGLGDLPAGAQVSFRPGATPAIPAAGGTPGSVARAESASGPTGVEAPLPQTDRSTAPGAPVVPVPAPPALPPAVVPPPVTADEAPAGTGPSLPPATLPRTEPASATSAPAPPSSTAQDPIEPPAAVPPRAVPAAPPTPDPVLTRPITAVAGRSHMPSDDAPLASVHEPSSASPGPEPLPAPAAQPTASAAEPVSGPTPAGGPQLRLEVAPDGTILASVDGSAPEPTTLDELREAAPALAQAGGTATVVSGSDAAAGLDIAAQIVTAFEDAGVRTSVEPPA